MLLLAAGGMGLFQFPKRPNETQDPEPESAGERGILLFLMGGAWVCSNPNGGIVMFQCRCLMTAVCRPARVRPAVVVVPVPVPVTAGSNSRDSVPCRQRAVVRV